MKNVKLMMATLTGVFLAQQPILASQAQASLTNDVVAPNQVNCGAGKADYVLDTNVSSSVKLRKARFEVLQNPQQIYFKSEFDFKSMPQLQVVQETGSFECEVRSIAALWSNYDVGADLSKVGCYKATIWWMPGSDYSGCTLKLTTPSQKDQEFVFDLFMNFNGE